MHDKMARPLPGPGGKAPLRMKHKPGDLPTGLHNDSWVAEEDDVVFLYGAARRLLFYLNRYDWFGRANMCTGTSITCVNKIITKRIENEL
jgi:hypothetical protein